MCARNRIALYGGTFDPVHLGHLAIARKVCELFEIDQVLFVPAQVAPHKVGHDVTPAIHRYAMLSLATQHDERLLVSTFELDSPKSAYTVDTLDHFKKALPDNDLFFIMGADSWTEISTWRDWRRLLTTANHIVVTRPGYNISAPHEELRDRLIDLRSSGKEQEQQAGTGRNEQLEGGSGKIFLTDAVMKDISATEVRRVAGEGRYEELAKLVPEPVAEYIAKYGIYRKSNEAKLNS
ncbi:MAG TPA: nicotinate-nucleotide adenylyltransferase [Pyrinomonadaceae bacterium]|nr:nicotinate-nucleotide adenylyltransferase [Pyrinomonadaceae bacterium]